MHYIVFAMLGLFSLGPAQEPVPPCQLQGAVFVESVAGFADHRVYVEAFESFAAFSVYKETNPAFANEGGHWYFTDIRSEADFTIFLEPVQSFADFSIFYTDFPTAAGCR